MSWSYEETQWHLFYDHRKSRRIVVLNMIIGQGSIYADIMMENRTLVFEEEASVIGMVFHHFTSLGCGCRGLRREDNTSV